MVIWYIFPRFGMLYPKKSGNPGSRSDSPWRIKTFLFNSVFSAENIFFPGNFYLSPRVEFLIRVSLFYLYSRGLQTEWHRTYIVCSHRKRTELHKERQTRNELCRVFANLRRLPVCRGTRLVDVMSIGRLFTWELFSKL
jgi:hypothetical protein